MGRNYTLNRKFRKEDIQAEIDQKQNKGEKKVETKNAKDEAAEKLAEQNQKDAQIDDSKSETSIKPE